MRKEWIEILTLRPKWESSFPTETTPGVIRRIPRVNRVTAPRLNKEFTKCHFGVSYPLSYKSSPMQVSRDPEMCDNFIVKSSVIDRQSYRRDFRSTQFRRSLSTFSIPKLINFWTTSVQPKLLPLLHITVRENIDRFNSNGDQPWGLLVGMATEN